MQHGEWSSRRRRTHCLPRRPPSTPGGCWPPCRACRPRGSERPSHAAEPRRRAALLRRVRRTVHVDYPGRRGRPAFRAVDGVTSTVGPGEVLGLVGESGSGKTTLGRARCRPGGPVAAGSGWRATIWALSRARPARRRYAGSRRLFSRTPPPLSTRSSRVGESVGEPLHVHRSAAGQRRGPGTRAAGTVRLPARTPTATRTSSPVASGSASHSPARSR